MQKALKKAGREPAVLPSIAALRAHVGEVRARGGRIALVPTMGALHDGHLELVRQGLDRAGHVIATVFVNPTQFGPNEDFAAYPRTFEADLDKLTRAGAQAVFSPDTAEMYPPGMATTVTVKAVSEDLCGAIRPGHFAGVATIVTKLLLQAMPDIALFGEKDWQQLQVIRRLVADLDIPVEIDGVPIVRDENGLALSSRNAYLSPQQYGVAINLNKILSGIVESIRSGQIWPDAQAQGRAALEGAGFDSIDYLEVRDAASLAIPAPGQKNGLRILAAVRLGRARLIDNMGV